MRRASAAVLAIVGIAVNGSARAQETPQSPVPAKEPRAEAPSGDKKSSSGRSPWLLVPLLASSPKLGTSFGGMGAYLHVFDEGSRVSLIGMNAQYTSTDSIVATAFARLSLGADHHRVTAITAFGKIKNNYDDYLGTGQPLKTNDDLKALAFRYKYRVKGNWFIGAQATATDYQVLGETSEDDFILESLGVKGFKSVGIGALVMHDSRDNQDMPKRGWYLNLNNIAYSESLGGSDTFGAYRADFRWFWLHGGRHVLAVRQYNWLTDGAPTAAQATVVLRGYKQGEYLAPYMSSIEAEERLSFGTRWGATAFVGLADLYGESATSSANRQYYPGWGVGLHFILKPVQRMLVNLEYAQGVEENHGIYLKFGYAW
jgi:hypothetical protein